MSSKRRKIQNNSYNYGMKQFPKKSKSNKHNFSSISYNTTNFTTPGVTNNKFAKWIARHFTILFIMMMIIILVISIAHLF